MNLQEVINLDTDENECMNVHPSDTNEINPIKDINDDINPIKDKLPETNTNKNMNDENPIEDPKNDASDKLPVPCQMDLDDPQSLCAIKKLQDMSGYNFEATNMNSTTDKNKLTKDITKMGENISPIKDTTNKDVSTENVKDTTNKDVATENVNEENTFDHAEIHKKVSSDEGEDENESEISEDEEDYTFTCKYHKTTTDIENFNEMDKRYMKKSLTFYKSYGQHGCRTCKSEFSATNKGIIAFHCNHEHCYFAICPNCQKKALKDSKINNTANDNKRCSKRRKQNTYPVVYAEGANTFNFW